MKASKDRTIHSETTVWREENEGTRRINVNNLLDRVKKEKLQNKKNNILIISSVGGLVLLFVLIISL
tara:strand:- start:202 stop:402 length:201 start_codon:yes stop_codon:yes gene_type:complete